MPDAADPSRGEQSGEGTGKKLPERVLLVMIVPNRTVLDDIVTGLLDMGVGGTIVESKGLMALVKEEMPVFSGLAALIGEQTNMLAEPFRG